MLPALRDFRVHYESYSPLLSSLVIFNYLGYEYVLRIIPTWNMEHTNLVQPSLLRRLSLFRRPTPYGLTLMRYAVLWMQHYAFGISLLRPWKGITNRRLRSGQIGVGERFTVVLGYLLRYYVYPYRHVHTYIRVTRGIPAHAAEAPVSAAS